MHIHTPTCGRSFDDLVHTAEMGAVIVGLPAAAVASGAGFLDGLSVAAVLFAGIVGGPSAASPVSGPIDLSDLAAAARVCDVIVTIHLQFDGVPINTAIFGFLIATRCEVVSWEGSVATTELSAIVVIARSTAGAVDVVTVKQVIDVPLATDFTRIVENFIATARGENVSYTCMGFAATTNLHSIVDHLVTTACRALTGKGDYFIITTSRCDYVMDLFSTAARPTTIFLLVRSSVATDVCRQPDSDRSAARDGEILFSWERFTIATEFVKIIVGGISATAGSPLLADLVRHTIAASEKQGVVQLVAAASLCALSLQQYTIAAFLLVDVITLVSANTVGSEIN